MPKKYALHPGEVISVNDGDRHHIGAVQLAHLYGVSMPECVIWNELNTALDPGDYVHLCPQMNGDYRLPE
jgi:hypothetical protein